MPIEAITEEDILIFINQTIKKQELCKKAAKTLFGYLKKYIQQREKESFYFGKTDGRNGSKAILQTLYNHKEEATGAGYIR